MLKPRFGVHFQGGGRLVQQVVQLDRLGRLGFVSIVELTLRCELLFSPSTYDCPSSTLRSHRFVALFGEVLHRAAHQVVVCGAAGL